MDENEAKGEFSRNFTQTKLARDLVDKAKANGENIGRFISACIEQYGPVLLKERSGPLDDAAPLQARLSYLEGAVGEWAYDELFEALEEEGSIPDHQKMLRKYKDLQWYGNLNKLMKTAEKHPKTKTTSRHNWRTLLLNRKKILSQSGE